MNVIASEELLRYVIDGADRVAWEGEAVVLLVTLSEPVYEQLEVWQSWLEDDESEWVEDGDPAEDAEPGI